MTLTRVALVFVLLSAAAAVRADEILLKSGKAMTGRITAETAKSYTIKLGANMYLSIAKEDVAKVKRSRPAVSKPQPRWRAPQVETSANGSAKPAASAPRAGAKPAASPAPAAVKNARDGAATESVMVGPIKIEKTTRFVTYPVAGADFAAVRKAILDRTGGKGFREGRRRSPSKTEWQADWSGTPGKGGKTWKSMVVTATATVTLPAWQARANVSPADADKWAAFLKEATDHETGHLEIVHDALVSFAESASNLIDPNEAELKSETTALFSAIKVQTAKRRQGYERRERRPPLSIKKK